MQKADSWALLLAANSIYFSLDKSEPMRNETPSEESQPGGGVYFFSNNKSSLEAGFNSTTRKFWSDTKEIALELILDFSPL